MFDRKIGDRLGKEDTLNDDGLRTRSHHVRECCIDLIGATNHSDGADVYAADPTRMLNLLKERFREWIRGVGKNPYAVKRRERIPKQLHALPCGLGTHVGQPRVVAAWPRKARHQPRSNRITDRDHDDWNRRGRLLCRKRARRKDCSDHIDLQLGQLSRQFW
jgi:hypothetical protein